MSEARYEVRPADNDAGFYYVLVAANGQVLETSETYGERWEAERGIDAAKEAAEDAE